jgi:hypothetical protein
MTTRARASAGEWAGERSAPGASAEAAPSRAGALTGTAADAGRLSPLPAAGGCSPLRGLRHRAKQISAGDPSNGADDYFAESRSQ